MKNQITKLTMVLGIALIAIALLSINHQPKNEKMQNAEMAFVKHSSSTYTLNKNKYGAGKCGDAKSEKNTKKTADKCGTGKTTDDKSKDAKKVKKDKCGEGKCGEGKEKASKTANKKKENKCGAGKCGSN